MKIVETVLAEPDLPQPGGDPAAFDRSVPDLHRLATGSADRADVLILHPAAPLSDESLRTLGRAVSSRVGRLLAQDRQGSLVRDVVERTVTGPARYSESRDAAPMHTDGMHMPGQPVPAYFSLTCLHQAARGGELSFAHLRDVLAGFADLPRATATLRRTFRFHTKGVDPGGRLWVERPVLEGTDDDPEIQYAREYIDLGHAADGSPPLDPAAVAVLDELDDILARPALQHRHRLGRGDIAVVDNRRVLHSRTAYQDADGAPARRMMRLWIAR